MRSKPELAECESCVCFAVRRAARAITQHYDRLLRPSGLRATQFALLVVLARSGEVPLNSVAERMGMERTTLTRNLRPLLSKRYITVDSGEDRRTRMIAVTERGLATVTEALPLWRKAQRAMTEQLPATTLKALATAGRVAT